MKKTEQDIDLELDFEPNQPIMPDYLPDYWLASHFKNRRLFIQQYSGKISTAEIHKEFGEWIVFAKGISTHAPTKKGDLLTSGHSFLIRLCDRSFAKITAFRIEVYADSFKLAVRRLNTLVKEFAATEDSGHPHFHLVSCCSVTGDLGTTQVALPNKGFMDDSELKLHYGDDFATWHQELVKKFKSKNHGVSIFRGTPGTGKTSYIRSLIAELHDSHYFLFMPLKIGWMLNAPETVRFWMEQKQQNPSRKLVAILEDAEHFLMQRGGDNASSASDLLNASDGLLGDFLQMHLICTVNCDVSQLDKAVTRSGRMLAYREFSRLTLAQAQKLAAAKKLEITEQDSYSLAEIYNGSQQVNLEKQRVGFA